MSIGRKVARAGACSIFLLVQSGMSALAADFDYEAQVGLGQSDNIRRTDTSKEDETIATAGTRFSVDQRSPRLEADLVGDLSYYEYLDDTYDSEVIGNFAGDARFGLIPKHIEWIVSDNFGQVSPDPFQPATPENRENINYFSTGPDLSVSLGTQSRLRLAGRYSMIDYEHSPLDLDTTSAELAFIREVTAASSWSLHATAAQTEYAESALNADYDQTEVFGRYEVQGARTELSVDLGYTEMDRDAVAEKEDGMLMRLDLARRMSAAATARLTAGHEFSNSGAAFAAVQSSGSVSVQSASGLQTAEPFTNDYVTLAWNYFRNRTGVDFSASWNDQSYETSPALDQTLLSYRVDLRRQMTQAMSASIGAQYSDVAFGEQVGDYDEIQGIAGLQWRLSRTLSLAFSYNYFTRSSDVATSEYSENRFFIYLKYGRGNPRSTLSGPEFGVDQAP